MNMDFIFKLKYAKNLLPATLLLIPFVFLSSCLSLSSNHYFGRNEPPAQNILRYVSGSEPESLDPQISSGQPEARIYMALFDGLVEYDPKTMQPIPAIAESWEISPAMDVLIFHLRQNARWSDGKKINAYDFVYSLRRGFAPDTASATANMGYHIKYAKAFNGNSVFVRKNGDYLLAGEFATGNHPEKIEAVKTFGTQTDFSRFIESPERLVLSGDEKKRAAQIAADPKLTAAIDGAEFVPVTKEDIGVEAVDDYTLRITLTQSTPFFINLLAHQFFRLVPQQAIEKHGAQWTNPQNIVTCGAFKVKHYLHYNELVVEKDPNYWDADKVRLDEIRFYMVEEQSTILNLYKAGEIDATPNHSVPASWIDHIRVYKDEYLSFPEAAISYLSINIKKPPMDNIKVRQAFGLAIDRKALARSRRTTKPLYDFMPQGIFPEYEIAKQKIKNEAEPNESTDKDSEKLIYDPEKARRFLAESGYKIISDENGFSCPDFPVDKVSLVFNTNESNRFNAEFIQAQWKQNLGITVPLKNLEFKTFLSLRDSVEFDGFIASNFGADYMDPFTFLGEHYTPQNNGATGWWDAEYDRLLDEANREIDSSERFEKLAAAESYLMNQHIVIPIQIPSTNWLKKPYVKGMYPNPGTLHPWKYVYIERDPNKWDTNVAETLK